MALVEGREEEEEEGDEEKEGYVRGGAVEEW